MNNIIFIKALIFLICLFCHIKTLADELYTDKYIVKLELFFSEPDYWNQLIKNKDSEIDIPATLIVNDSIFFDSVGVRFKGNSSYNIPNDKKSFNISIDEYNSNYRLFGYKTLNLNNCFVDPTFVREKISNEIALNFMPAPATGFAKLYINGTYWGLYSNVEQINKIFLSKWFSSNKGNLYKGDPKGNLIWRGNNAEQYKKDYEKKTNEEEDNWNDLIKLINIINNSPNLLEELKTVLNVDRAIWYIALCNILVNLDSYIFSGHNYYLYNNPETQQFNILNWDMNESFGVFPPQLNNREKFELINNQNPNLPLLKAIFNVPEFKEIYLAHYKTILNKYFISDSVVKRVNELHNLIDEAVKSDTKKLYSYNDFKKNVTEDVFVQGRIVPGLVSFIQKRRNYLFGLFDITRESPLLRNLKISKEKPYPNDTVIFTVESENSIKIRNVFLLYKLGEGFYNKIKMFDDGLHNDGKENDGLYGVSFIIPQYSEGEQLYYYSIAESNTSVLKFEPEEAEFQVYKVEIQNSGIISKLFINEFMADNKKTIKNEEGIYADWIEIYNPNNYEVTLKGMYLTDDTMNTKKWTFPDTSIAPKGYMLIWADESKSKIGLHANFKLSKQGEYIGIYSSLETGNVLIDSYTFQEQSTDISEGRYPNGIGNFVFMEKPTPNSENILESNISDNVIYNSYIKITPNPAEDYIIVKNELFSDFGCNLELINNYGQKINDIQIIKINDNTFYIDIKSLNSGIYYLRILNNEKIYLNKIIIVK